MAARPKVCGILNVTPDSFSDGGRFFDTPAAVARGLCLAAEGADVIDVGGVSTRPGALPVSINEELRRVIPVIRALARQLAIPISVDTSAADVANQALAEGAAIINDVTALRDPWMAEAVARAGASVILMHMQGTPQTMQRDPQYQDVAAEVAEFLREAALRAEAAGIARGKISIDPGLGFGKTVEHNLELLRSLDRFVAMGYPVVLGASRKSFISAALKVEAQDRLLGSLGCAAHAARCGVAMVRVHDVKPTVDLFRMLEITAAVPAGGHETRR